MDIVHKITQTLDVIKIPSAYKVISATRSPDKLEKYMKTVDNQIDLYIVVSGLSTILSGAVVSHTTKPVIGVPCNTGKLGLDSLLSMVEMPRVFQQQLWGGRCWGKCCIICCKNFISI